MFKIRMAYYFPVLNIYGDFKFKTGAKARCFFNLIKNKYLDEEGLLLHEMNHSKQFFRFSRKSWLYHFSKKWRLKSELECYALQTVYNVKNGVWSIGECLTSYSEYLVDWYDLDIKYTEAMELLKKEVKKYGS